MGFIDSARHEGDHWDLASSVGATATMVAAARAIATRAERPLINDPFAELLVRAVGIDVFARLASGELSVTDLDNDATGPSEGMLPVVNNMAVRTKFFDEFFLDATKSGIRQAVILASGLDSRAYRLPWPAKTIVYEIDQPQVIEFKTRTLAGLGAVPTASWRTVAIDLRDNWPAALCAAGFDPSRSTAWSAEGLLGYLPPEAQDRLLDTITAVSAPGSRLATESVPNIDPADQNRLKERMQNVSEQWRKHGFHLDMTKLVYLGNRNEVATYLSNHGWQIIGRSIRDLFVDNGLPPLEDESMPTADPLYIIGTLTGGGKNRTER